MSDSVVVVDYSQARCQERLGADDAKANGIFRSIGGRGFAQGIEPFHMILPPQQRNHVESSAMTHSGEWPRPIASRAKLSKMEKHDA